MGIHLELVDTDQVFDTLDIEPTIINRFNTSIPEEKAALDQELITHYSTDTIDEGASCTCGCFVGVYNEGLVCNICNTEVQSTIDKAIRSMLWIEAPAGILGLIDPEVWLLLSEQLTGRGFNALEWFANTTYQMEGNKIPSEEIKRNIAKLEKQFGNRRGLNNLVRHFDEIMHFVLNDTNIVEKSNRANLKQFIAENRGLFFPKHIPIPSKICFIVENTNSGRYIDGLLGPAICAVRTVSSIRSSVTPLKSSVVQNRLVKAIKELAAFYMGYNKRNVFKKPGLYRRHVFGGRTDFTGRAVITSLSDPHDYRELHIPWGLAVQMFKYHIINKLLKREYAPGRFYTPNRALAFVYSNVLRYNAELDLLIQELIAEAPGGSIPCILNRNPTLQRGSMQRFLITKVKTDVRDNTFGMSALCLKAPNADFDGDQLNLILILDNWMAAKAARLAPHLWVFSTEEPRKLSRALELQGPVIDTIVNWMYADYLKEA